MEHQAPIDRPSLFCIDRSGKAMHSYDEGRLTYNSSVWNLNAKPERPDETAQATDCNTINAMISLGRLIMTSQDHFRGDESVHGA